MASRRDERPYRIYECECGYRSLSPGRCRSHPYPARAMGPEMREVELIPHSDLAEMIQVLQDCVGHETAPCSFDHHGYCQEHGYLQEGECHVARGRRLLGLALGQRPVPEDGDA